MEFQRKPLHRILITVAGVASLAAAGSPGCGRDQADHESVAAIETAAKSVRPVDHLSEARRKLRIQDWDGAAAAAYKALLEDPDNADASLLAGEAEAARGNPTRALDLAAAIELDSRLGQRATELRYHQLVELKRFSEAADVLLAALESLNDHPRWRHRAWELLNRVGRRQEASHQALMLCRQGLATEPQMHSLIRQNRAFPFSLPEGDSPNDHFEPGLGLARWYFSKEDYRRALNELGGDEQESLSSDGNESAAAIALRGRLLAETQNFEELAAWHAGCNDPVRQHGDYWAAIGTYLYDQRQFEAAARAWLESAYRNPTDRLVLQRLSKAFHSLERPREGDGYRERGIQIADTERYSDALLETDDPAIRMSLAKKLAALGRPFETLYWTGSLAEKSSREWATIERQRTELSQSERVATMAAESSLLGMERDQFEIDDAIELLESSQRNLGGTSSARDILARPRLTDVAAEVGIEFRWYRDVEFDKSVIPIHESVGGGIAVLDYDLDGWPDAYFAQGSGDPPTDRCTRSNQFQRNLGGRFDEVTAHTATEDYHYSSGLAAGDFNQDGFADLYLGALGHNRLLLNNGDGTFSEVTDRLNVTDDRFTSSLAIADINGDHLPDLFETNYITMDGGFVLPETDADGKPKLPGPLSHYSGRDRWFENLGDGRFQTHEIDNEVTLPGTSLGIVITDFDDDQRNDVFIGNDVRANHLLVHRGANRLVNLADPRGIGNGYSGIPNGCMGISAADFNRDGKLDLHITNFNNESSNLYIQQEGGLFSDVAIRYGIDEVTDPMVGFGTKSIDFDRNGWLDLIITNGHIFDTRIYGEPYFEMPPQVLMGTGQRFELTAVQDDGDYWDRNYLGRAMASLDFDRDGAVDVLVGHLHEPVALLHNQTATAGRSLQLELVGTTCERDATGTKVVLETSGGAFTHWVTAGDGYFCSDESFLDFGLPEGTAVERVVVVWPGGNRQTFDNLESGRRYLLIEGQPDAEVRQANGGKLQ